MADKMNEKTNETLTAEKDKQVLKVPAAPTALPDDSDFEELPDREEQDRPDDQDETEAASYTDAVYAGTFMQRMVRSGVKTDGKKYYEYVVGLKVRVSEEITKTHTVHFKLKKEYAEAYEYLDLAFLNGNKAPLYILRTEMSDNRTNRKSVFYTPQVMFKDMDGVEYAIPMVPVNENDKAQFGYLVNRLKFRGILK